MRVQSLLPLVVALSFIGAARAQQACTEIEKIIDEAVFAAAISVAEGEVFDKSAPQQTSRYLNLNNHLQVIGINVALLAQNRCPARTRPINPMRYKLQAMACMSERLAEKKADPSTSGKCDVKAWRFE